jgi:hypothetical protein
MVMQFMFGLKISPLSLKVLWTQVFPDDIAGDEDDDNEEFRPLNANNDVLPTGLSSSSYQDIDDRFITTSKSSRPNSPCVDIGLGPYTQSRIKESHRSPAKLHQDASSTSLASDLGLLSLQSSNVAKQQPKKTLIRQRTKKLNLQSLSPLLRNYYSTSNLTHEKSAQLLKLTIPVSNCLVGGSDTYKKRVVPPLSDDISK